MLGVQEFVQAKCVTVLSLSAPKSNNTIIQTDLRIRQKVDMDESAVSSMATKLIENGFNNTRGVTYKSFAVFLLSKSSSSSAMANVLMKSFKCHKEKYPQCILTFHEALKQYGLVVLTHDSRSFEIDSSHV